MLAGNGACLASFGAIEPPRVVNALAFYLHDEERPVKTASPVLAVAATLMAFCAAPRAEPSSLTHFGATPPLATTDWTAGKQPQDAQVQQVELYSTFNTDPNNLYDSNLSGAISGPGTGIKISWGASFSPVTSGFAKTLTLPLRHYEGTNEVRVSLRADAGGKPGTTIRKATVQDLPSTGGCCQTVSVPLHDKDIGPPFLTSGTAYWILVETTKAGTDTDAGWPRNNRGLTSSVIRYYGQTKDVFEDTTFAFKVTGR